MLTFLEKLIRDPVAIFAGLSVCANILLWWSTRQLVMSSERTAKKQLRAYIFFKEFSVEEVPSRDVSLVNNWRITVSFENVGNTPARNLRVQTNYYWSTERMSENFEFPDIPERKPVSRPAGPKGIVNAPYLDIPKAVVEQVGNGSLFVYIWGWVDYDDIINGSERHRTEFCVQLLKDGPSWCFEPHGKFNDFDHGCYRVPSAYKV